MSRAPAREVPPPTRMTVTTWLIVLVASIGFIFDTYSLLIMPLIGRPALTELLGVDPYTPAGNKAVLDWTGYILFGSAVSGGIFGLLGGYLTDRLGRRRVLVWSILLYAVSALASAFARSALVLLVLRCTTFIGVCVEFVAAVAWLAELFPNPQQREKVLGITQAFSSLGGFLVSGAYVLSVKLAPHLPAIYGEHAPWRYALISALLPAIPLMIIRPFLPESPAWQQKKDAGSLRRPSFLAIFAPALRRTTIVSAIMFACSLGAAFGTIQIAPQIVPGLVPQLQETAKLQKKYQALRKEQATSDQARAQIDQVKGQIRKLGAEREAIVGRVQVLQETGGLVGRCVIAALALVIVSRRALIRFFLLPGLIIVPWVFAVPGIHNLDMFTIGMFIAGFFTVAQLSFWGLYLPRVYPTHLRGTGESFAANVGGRMIGTFAAVVTTQIGAPLFARLTTGTSIFAQTAYAAACTGVLVYAIAIIASFFLPEPPREALPD